MPVRAPKNITDYFQVKKPKLSDPVSVFRADPLGQSANFATILDLPNELLLSILDILRQDASDDPSMLLMPKYLEHLHRETDVEASRILYAVCRRFFRLFSSVAFERIRCGQRLQALSSTLEDMEDFPKTQVKELHFYFREPEPRNSILLSLYGPICLGSLTAITTVTLYNINLDATIILLLGSLPNLTTLMYKEPFSHRLLRTPDQIYGDYRPSTLQSTEQLIPRKLQTLHVHFAMKNASGSEMAFLEALLKASCKTLTTVIIKLYEPSSRRNYPPNNILQMKFPNLTRFAIYKLSDSWELSDSWGLFSLFYTTHAPRLKEVRVLSQEDTVLHNHIFSPLTRMPGMRTVDGVDATYLWTSYDMNLQIDPAGNLTATELSLGWGNWEMLYTIGERHPYIRVLSIWDATLKSSSSPLEILKETGPHYSNLEILRFNSGARGLHGPDPESFWFCHEAEGNQWCDCTGCSSGAFTIFEQENLVSDWEIATFSTYEGKVRQILDHFPKLKLVEWFIQNQLGPFREEFVPFWRWEAVRAKEEDNNSVLSLKGTLINPPHSHPLLPAQVWSAQYGITHAKNDYPKSYE